MEIRCASPQRAADQYPYAASSTTLAAIMPSWALEGGIVGMLVRLADPGARVRIREEIAGRSGADVRHFEPETIMISSVPEGPGKVHEGLLLTEIAARRGEDPVETALHLLESEHGAVQMIVFGMSEDDVRRVMRHPAVAIASDGWTLSPSAGGKPHPRSYGTFARVLGTYVREEGVLGLEEAVRKMTSLPAHRLGRSDLGRIHPGCVADLVVFDPERVAERATFEDPHRFVEGVSHVVVNGQLVIDGGEDTGAAAGRVLRRTQA